MKTNIYSSPLIWRAVLILAKTTNFNLYKNINLTLFVKGI